MIIKNVSVCEMISQGNETDLKCVSKINLTLVKIREVLLFQSELVFPSGKRLHRIRIIQKIFFFLDTK